MYKKLEIDFDIPGFLETEINKFVDYINGDTSKTLEDCFRTEIHLAIRDSGLLKKEKECLENYYVRGGIYSCKTSI